MIKFEKLRYKVGGSYPKDPVLRQNRRGKADANGDYGKVDLAMREPVRIINEELKLRTLDSCECHPDDVDPKDYEAFRFRDHADCFTYRTPYSSYIVVDMGKYGNAIKFMEYLKKLGFIKSGEASTKKPNRTQKEGETAKSTVKYGIRAEFSGGILGLKYAYEGPKDEMDGVLTIDVASFERQYIRRWKEWDKIRDTGLEYWLELLRSYRMGEQ
jgi:hypothetical protein